MTIEEIKRYLKKNKITYQTLSDKSGIPVGTLKNIFSKCAINPRLDTMQAIERALGFSDDNSLTPEERAAGASEMRRTSITPIEDEMLYLFREIGKKHGENAQRALITVAEKML